MERFAETVYGWKTLTIFAKVFILDVWQSSGYGSRILLKEIICDI